MNKILTVCALALIACGSADTPSSTPQTEKTPVTAKEKSADLVVSKEALEYFCGFLWEFDPKSLADVPNENKQSVMAKQMSDGAQANGIQDWATFEKWLTGLDPEEKNQQLEAVIQQHDLQIMCLAVRNPQDMTPQELRLFKLRYGSNAVEVRDGSNAGEAS